MRPEEEGGAGVRDLSQHIFFPVYYHRNKYLPQRIIIFSELYLQQTLRFFSETDLLLRSPHPASVRLLVRVMTLHPGVRSLSPVSMEAHVSHMNAETLAKTYASDVRT